MTVAARQLRIISTSPHPEHPCLVLWCEQIPSRVSWHSVRQTQEPTNRLGCQQMLVPRFCSVPSQALTGPHCRLSAGAGGVAHLSRMVETDPLCVAARRAAVHVSLAGPPGGSLPFPIPCLPLDLDRGKSSSRTTTPNQTGSYGSSQEHRVSNNTFPITPLAPSLDLARTRPQTTSSRVPAWRPDRNFLKNSTAPSPSVI